MVKFGEFGGNRIVEINAQPLAAPRRSPVEPVEMLVRELWLRHGRCVYSRHDYEAIATDKAGALMAALEASLAGLAGRSFGPLTVAAADQFAYVDPVDGSESRNQGVRVMFADGSRIVYRLSGTGTVSPASQSVMPGASAVMPHASSHSSNSLRLAIKKAAKSPSGLCSARVHTQKWMPSLRQPRSRAAA